MVTSFKRSHACTAPLSALDPAAGHHWRLLDTHRQVWVSLLWGHCSFLLGLGAHKVLFVPSKSLFPVLCKFWQLYGGVNGNLLQEALCHTQVCCTQSPCPCGSPLLTHASAGDTQTQFWICLCEVSGSWYVQDLFESSKCLWWVWNLILNLISPLLLSCWGFSFALGHVVSFFGGIQHPPVDSCSAASCNFGFLTGEDEHISFYSTIFLHHLGKV